MRPAVTIAVLAVLLGTLLALREARLSARLRALEDSTGRFAAAAQDGAARVAELESEIRTVRRQAAAATVLASTTPAAPPPPANVPPGPGFPGHGPNAPLPRSVSAPPPVPPRTVPEYDPTQPPPPEPPSPAAPEPVTGPAPGAPRNWGQEQILGAPDTDRAGDVPTAWASREPDGGPEWLQAGFDQEVDIAEIRIRETYNPGAISKVTALVGGQETVLWEGTAAGGSAPRDFVVRPPFDLRARSVVVHLDTTRVSGWNELDAVELVGRDGSRQWATSADASSTYAERTRARGFDFLTPGTEPPPR